MENENLTLNSGRGEKSPLINKKTEEKHGKLKTDFMTNDY